MPQKILQIPDAGPLFQQMRGKTVAAMPLAA